MLLRLLLVVGSLPFLVLSERELFKTPLTVVNPVKVVQYNTHNFASPQYHEKSFFKALRKVKKIFTHPSNHIKAPVNNTACYKTLIQLEQDLTNGSMYAFKALDSWGKPESGYLQGNNKWTGRFKECLDATNSTKGNLFNPQFCSGYVGTIAHPNPPIATIGGCFPDNCNITEINGLIYTIIPQPFYAVFSCDPISFPDWESKDKAALALTSMLLLLVVISTSYDLSRRFKAYQKTQYHQFMEEEIDETPKPPSGFTRALMSFSAIENTKMLLDTTQKDGQIHCLHGIRFFSMCWVVLGHSQLFAMQAVDNQKYFFDWTFAHWGHQIVVNGTFSVDTFFFLSGLLVAYLGMKETERRRGRINPFLMYIGRFMRLTPAYAFIIFFSVTLWLKLGEGPYFVQAAGAMKTSCAKYWWTNLLYINNMYPSSMTDECYGVGWYLANDMQFYLLCPLFLFLLYKLPVVGAGIISALIVFSIFLTGLASNITKQQPMVLALSQAYAAGANQLSAEHNSTALGDDPKHYSDFLQDTYAKPYFRLGAYFIGFLTGYVMHKHRHDKIRIPKIINAVGWMTCTAMCAAIIFGIFPVYKVQGALSNNTAAFYNAVSRPLWCVGMAWITIACLNGYGGPVNGLLSWKVFMPLSKLTYNSYLIHPMVLYTTYYSVERPIHVDMYHLTVLYIGQLVLVHVLAYILALVVEFPFSNLVKLLLDSLRPSSRSPPLSNISNGIVRQNSFINQNGKTEIFANTGNGTSSEA